LAELDAIVETLRRQRKDLEELIERVASSSGETAELVGRIEDLRRRADDTQRRFLASVKESKSDPRG
jgi:uncharacterized coiled-coil DUF342 family protein